MKDLLIEQLTEEIIAKEKLTEAEQILQNKLTDINYSMQLKKNL